MKQREIAALLDAPACAHNHKSKSGCARPKPGATAADLLVGWTELLVGVGAETMTAVAPGNVPVLVRVRCAEIRIGDLEDLGRQAGTARRAAGDQGPRRAERRTARHRAVAQRLPAIRSARRLPPHLDRRPVDSRHPLRTRQPGARTRARRASSLSLAPQAVVRARTHGGLAGRHGCNDD